MERFGTDGGCEQGYPIKKTALIIEGKWTTLVIRELLTGKKRYSHLQRALEGISPKVLSARLRMLEEKKLISRTVFATVPVTTEYALTELGLKLQSVLLAMAEFGEQWQQQS